MILKILAIIGPLLGIIGTIVAWRLNPRRQYWEEVDKINEQIEKCYKIRDASLKSNNRRDLTIAVNQLIKLRNDKKLLLQRFGNYL